MLYTRLTGSQASKNWDIIRQALYKSMPIGIPATEKVMTNVLEAILKEDLQVWVMHESDFEENRSIIIAFILTTIIEDTVSKIRSLMIYSVFGEIKKEHERDWVLGYQTLVKYAKYKKCDRICGYTNLPKVIKQLSRFGVDASSRFIFSEVR